MERRQRKVEQIVNDVILRKDEEETAEAIVAAYEGGVASDYLLVNTREGEETVLRGYNADMLLRGLRLAVAGNPASHDLFELSEQHRQRAAIMLEEYGQSQEQTTAATLDTAQKSDS